MKICYIQPILTLYRAPFFNAIVKFKDVSLTVRGSIANDSFGNLDGMCDFIWEIDESERMRELSFKCIWLSFKASAKNDVIVHFGDYKFPSLVFCMFFCIFFRKKFFIHGQGGYKKKGFLHKLVYNFSMAFISGYICYSDFSRDNLKRITLGFFHKKIFVMDNSLYLECREFICNPMSKDVLYIGRLRNACGIELLLKACSLTGLNVNVIGGGDDSFIRDLQNQYDNLVYHGAVFDEDKQYEIALNCFVGAYGGDAGLSVVHYMAFGLPVVVHDELYKHMGPEPSYVKNGENGLTFKRGDADSLSEALITLKNNFKLRQKLASGAINTFKQLQNPPMHEKFARILGIL